MPYAGDRICHDADSHVVELPGWLNEHADPGLRDRLKPLDLGLAGGKAAEAIERAAARARGGQAEVDLSNSIAGPKGWFAPGAFDPAERSRVLDHLGFASQLVFSTFALSQFLGADRELLYGGARAHNRAITAFCADDERLLPVGFVPLDDPGATLREARDAIRFGCRAIALPLTPPRHISPTHPDHDGLWALLEESNVPFMLHIGFGGSRFIPPGFHANGRPVSDFIGGGENLRAKDYAALGHGPAIFLAALALDGIFEHFPRLRGGCIELGASWVVPWLRQIDQAQRMFSRSEPAVKELSMRPSDYVRRQVKFTPFAGEDVGWMIEQAGEELFLFSSDYPHPEGTRDPIGRFEQTLTGASKDAVERFYARNFVEMMSGQG